VAGGFRIAEEPGFDAWDDLVSSSPQGTVFATSAYLQAMGKPAIRLFVNKGNTVKCGLLLIPGEDPGTTEFDDLVIYGGIMFPRNEEQSLVKSRAEKFEVVEFLLTELDHRYCRISISLAPGFEDLRPFLWHNYSSGDATEKYSLVLRYTSILDISQFFLRKPDEDTGLYQNLHPRRKSDIRKAAENGLVVEEEPEIDMLLEFYERTLAKAGRTVSVDKLSRLRQLVTSLHRNRDARVFVVKNGQNVTYVTVFSTYKNQGCYLFGAGNSEKTSRYDGTLAVWQSMKLLSRYGVSSIDMEGVNSPQRGAFKLGFAGDLTPYYRVSKGG
jgi:hypothetical protein